jgi:hypothetical protein
MTRLRRYLVAPVALLACSLFPGLPGWAAAAPPAEGGEGERPVLKIEGEGSGDGKGEGEEPTLPGSGEERRPALKMRYKGVAPGRTELPPSPPRLPLSAGPQRMTWPGFQAKDGKATVFLQLSGPVEYSVSERAGALVLTLHDTVVTLRNNLRPLSVEEFRTPVRRISFEARKGTVVVTVGIKGEVAHQERLEKAENGFSMLILQVQSTREEVAQKAAPAQAAPPEPPAAAQPAQASVRKPPPPAPAPAPSGLSTLEDDSPIESETGGVWMKSRALKARPQENAGERSAPAGNRPNQVDNR